jgi:hypothetical protein
MNHTEHYDFSDIPYPYREQTAESWARCMMRGLNTNSVHTITSYYDCDGIVVSWNHTTKLLPKKGNDGQQRARTEIY